jgi:hypothetical protein
LIHIQNTYCALFALQHSTALLESITGMQLLVRLGLLSSDGQWLVVQHIAPGNTTAAAAAAEDTAAGPRKGQGLAAASPRLLGAVLNVEL